MGLLSLPFMSQGGGGSVVIEVAAARTTELPPEIRTTYLFDEGEVMASSGAGWELDSTSRTVVLYSSSREVQTPTETRLVVLGTETRTILA